MNTSLLQAARIIKSGGVVVYPTETLYALGCHPADRDAVDTVYRAKDRDVAKPLPLIVGSWEQFVRFTRANDAVRAVVAMFWPGPLSVLVGMQGELPSRLMDKQGRTSLRFTPHPVARELCRLANAPLVATSANPSGQPGAARLEDLDPELGSRVDMVVGDQPFPQGGAPSTLIEVVSATRVRILRKGAIPPERFVACGIGVEDSVVGVES
ncbi:L-threonylcarbamoyladenylate synthase [Desulfoplanes sp.]